LSEKDAYRNLANAVVVQAADDWRYLCGMLAGTKKPKDTTEIYIQIFASVFQK
jgi:hypothetical protein